MTLVDIALLGADTARTRAYIDLLRGAGLCPARALFLGGRGPGVGADRKGPTSDLFDDRTPAPHAARRAGIPLDMIDATDINAPQVATAVGTLAQSVVIYSGPGGAIVGPSLFAIGKRFLHVHPGHLPEFRGSTTIYYGLLAEDRVRVTALFLEPRIDGGPVVGRADYPPPVDRRRIDMEYDPYVRAVLLVGVLRDYANSGGFNVEPQGDNGGGPYYIIHPVLKHIAIMAGD